MIPRQEHRVLVLGITGKQGQFWTQKMRECGTQVVAGVNPKKAGTVQDGVPVFASAQEAAKSAPFDIAVMFVPPMGAKDSAIDAIEAGAQMVVVLTEHIPQQDVMLIHAAARRHGTRIFGPNTAGLVTPGAGFIGIMPGFNANVFRPGTVGVISRSGSLGTLVCLNLTRAGFGQSAFLGVGGDPLPGTTSRQALELLEADKGTRGAVLVGEIGGGMEEDAADYARSMTKPVVAFITGRASPPGKRMGHAGAIVLGDRGSYESKRSALEKAGVRVAATPGEIGPLLAARLKPDF
jgi:succinyl-CoA synthetase alpha subunit